MFPVASRTLAEFLTASSDGTIKHWDLKTGQDLETIQTGEKLRSLVTDGWTLLAGGDKGFLR